MLYTGFLTFVVVHQQAFGSHTNMIIGIVKP